MKKMYTTILCLILCTGLMLTGCQNNRQTTKPNAGQTATSTDKAKSYSSLVTEPGAFPVVNEKVTLKFFAPQSSTVENMETNEFTKWYEEKTNVHVSWELTPQNAVAEKRKLSLVSGDFPDVYFAAEVTREEEMQNGPAGIFIPLNDLIDTYTKYIKDAFIQMPMAKQMVVTTDSHIYSIPKMGGSLHVTMPNKMWINTAWLKALNLQMPKTTEEFYNVLKAFKEKDPNGNGKKDEIPMIGAKYTNNSNGNNAAVEGFLMNAFIYNDTKEKLNLKDGKVDVAYDKPEWKKGLEYMKKLYSEGLIDSSAFTMTIEQMKQLVESVEIPIVGAVTGQGINAFANMKGTRHKDFQVVPPLKGPDGVQTSRWEPYQNYKSGAFVITKACKNPEIAMRWIDYLYSTEGTLRSRFGSEGQEWRKPNPGEKTVEGKDATWTLLKPLGTIQNVSWAGLNSPPQNTSVNNMQASTYTDINSSEGLEAKLYQATLLYDPYKPKEVVPPMYMDKKGIQTYSQQLTDLNGYVNESVVQFVTGKLDLNKDWNTYLKNLDTMGLKDYLTTVQKTYDQFVKANAIK